MATLGISMNTRLVGLAIINEGQLMKYAIRLHKSAWSPSKVTQIITSLKPCVSQYCIKKVVLSIPYAHHQTKAFKSLIARVTAFFVSQRIPVYTQLPEALHSLYPEGQKKTKKAFMEALTLEFPELTYCLYKELRNKKRYYIKLFEAVAAAVL